MFTSLVIYYMYVSGGWAPRECLENSRGRNYAGTRMITKGGLTCQRWDRQTPHSHKWGSLGGDENYCRNAGNSERLPWCYTTSGDKRWEYCDIPLCGEFDFLLNAWGGGCRVGELGGDENYCRNAGNNERLPWCYTTSGDKLWEYCDLSICGMKIFVTNSNLK